MEFQQKRWSNPSTISRNSSVGRRTQFILPIKSDKNIFTRNKFSKSSQNSFLNINKPLIKVFSETKMGSRGLSTSRYSKEINKRSLSRKSVPELFRAIRLPTVEANRNIKNKIEEYEAYRRSKAKQFNDLLQCKHPHIDLQDKFLEIGARINTLLATNGEIIELPANYRDNIEIEAGLNYFYQLRVKDKPLPIKIKVSFIGKQSRGVLFVSGSTKRPNDGCYGKKWDLNSRDTIAIFYGRSDNEGIFSEEFVYVTIHAERNLSLNFEYCFGKLSTFSNSHLAKKRGQFMSKVPSRKMIERMIESLVTDESSFKKMSKSARLIIKRRHEKCLSLAGNVDYIQQNQTRVHTMQHLRRPGEFEIKHNLVLRQKNALEQQELTQQFFEAYKWKINKYHDEMLFKKRINWKNNEQKMQVWVGLITLLKAQYFIYAQFKKQQELYLEKEKKVVAACRIRLIHSISLRKFSDNYKKRFKFKLNSGLISGEETFHEIAKKRASDALLGFLEYHKQISKIYKAFFVFERKIQRIQHFWRGILQNDSFRIHHIKILWDNTAKNIIKINCKGNKKQQNFARRVRLIPETQIFKILTQYYREVKLKFLKTLFCYYNQQQASKGTNSLAFQSDLIEVTENNFLITSVPASSDSNLFLKRKSILLPKEKKYSSVNKAGTGSFSSVPQFQYLPSSEQLLNIIILTAEKMLVYF